MIAGPSEILIIADKSANPKFLAADLMSQAEHDRLASAILLIDCEELAKETETELEKQMEIQQAQVRLITAANAQMLFHYWKIFHLYNATDPAIEFWRDLWHYTLLKR